MKLRPDYSGTRGKLFDITAGFITAILVNGLILRLSRETAFLHLNSDFIDLLPWVINGLFLLVFLLILPWFALGYLLAGAVILSISMLAMPIPLTEEGLFAVGCFLLIAGIAGISLGSMYLGTLSADTVSDPNSLEQLATLAALDPVMQGIIGLIACIMLVALSLLATAAHLRKGKAEEDEDQEEE